MIISPQPSVNKIHIALAFDQHYLVPAETLIKSICCYNRGVVLYIIHENLTDEWFIQMQERLAPLHCEIYSLFFQLPNLPTLSNPKLRYITNSTYFRYFVPHLVSAERVLYLDVDTLVTSNLSSLFQLSMQGKILAAVNDRMMYFHEHYYFPFKDEFELGMAYRGGKFESYFNAGVLLIDVNRWKQIPYLTERLVRMTQIYDKVIYADQDILNFMFYQNWFPLSYDYNLQTEAINTYIGRKYGINGYGHYYLDDVFEQKGIMPKIIHFIGEKKPWLNSYRNWTEFHYQYQGYINLDWNDIYQKWQTFS